MDNFVWRRGHWCGTAWRSTAALKERGGATMQGSAVPRAVAAAKSTASSLGLTVDEAIVLHDSNKLTLRLLPCDVLARVAPVAHQVAQFELELAQQLLESGCPVAALEPRVEPRVYEGGGFVVTLWTYYEPLTPREVSPADYADALARLHAGMRKLDVTTPHFMDRVHQAQQLVASRTRATCSTRRTGCCSSTSRRVAVALWNSTSPMRPKKSASTIRVSIAAYCASAGFSCWR